MRVGEGAVRVVALRCDRRQFGQVYMFNLTPFRTAHDQLGRILFPETECRTATAYGSQFW